MQNQFTGNNASEPDIDTQSVHSAMAEKAVLGGLLRKENTLAMLAALLTEGDFYLHANRLIFSQIVLLRHSGKPHDLIAVAEALEINGELIHMGGLGYLTALQDNLPADSDIMNCAVILRERQISRRAPTAIDANLLAWAELLRNQTRERTRKNLLKITLEGLATRVLSDTNSSAGELLEAAIADLIQLKSTPSRSTRHDTD